MNKKIIILIVLVLVLTLTGCEKEKKNPDDKKDFTTSFLKMENNEKNMIYSPLSIKYALKMLNEGASGSTKEEIEAVIGDQDITRYKNIDKVLSLANAAFIRDTYKDYVRDSFRDNLTEKYDAEINYDKFDNANNINDFINTKTFGIIKRLIDDSIVQNEQTKLVLVNALAIDMKWTSNFSKTDTYGEEFTLASGEKIDAAMMHQSKRKNEYISFYKGDDVTALAMDLDKTGDTELEFMVIMPDKNLSEYVKDFNVSEIKNIKSKLKKASDTKDGVDIAMPKFDFEYSLKLKEDLQNLGIKKAFISGEADFTNMTTDPIGLFVSDALHKAKIEVSEDGIRAAAVTAFTMEANAFFEEVKPEKITIDKPFLFVISDKSNGEVWFVGTVYQPTIWNQ